MHVYYLNRVELTEYKVVGHEVLEGRRYPNNEDGQAALAQALTLIKHNPCILLVDQGGENIVVQQVPFTTGKDRAEMLARKIQQLLNNTSYALTMSLGREKTGRRDERIIFYGLTQSERLQNWVNVFRKAQVVFAGLLTPALVAQTMLNMSMPKVSRGGVLLLLAFEGMLRQYFYLDGKLRTSRLIQLPEKLQEQDVARLCEQETFQLRNFLISQQLMPRDGSLLALMPISPAWERTYATHMAPTEEINFQFISFAQMAQKYKLLPRAGEYRPTELLAYVAAAHAKKNPQLAPEEQRKSWQRLQIFHGLALAAGALGVVLTIVGAVFFGIVRYQEGHLRDIEQQVAQNNQQRDRILQELPPLPLAVDDLRDIVQAMDNLRSKSPQLKPILQHISQALDAFPDIALLAIQWVAAEGETPSTTSLISTEKATLRLQLPRSYQANQRQQLETAKNFSQMLNSDGYRAIITQQPFDIDSSKPLSVTETNDHAPDPPRFAIQLERVR